jgi:hypothetical protein
VSLDFYRTPVAMSDPASQAALLDDLPQGPEALAGIVQGLMMHEHIASTYGLELSGAQHAQAHTRSVEEILKEIVAHDPRPLATARPADERQGVPARARCGFAAYFMKAKVLDHWVTEYWNEKRRAWVLFDPQIDAHQRVLFRMEIDPTDVPRDQFLVGGDAWRLCRSGRADPMDFGILDLFGWWMIAGNVVRDIAALNNREMLPWDCWQPMPRPDEEPNFAQFDRLAVLSHDPDGHWSALREAYRSELAVPSHVMNAVRDRLETV